MNEAIRGNIRKLTLGTNPKDAKAVSVGTIIHGLNSRIVEITRDRDYFIQTGKEKFLVYLENAQNVKYVWNEIIDIPVVIEYADPKDEPKHIH